MTQPIVPVKLLPWVEFGENTVYLKPDCPKKLKPLFDSLTFHSLLNLWIDQQKHWIYQCAASVLHYKL